MKNNSFLIEFGTYLWEGTSSQWPAPIYSPGLGKSSSSGKRMSRDLKRFSPFFPAVFVPIRNCVAQLATKTPLCKCGSVEKGGGLDGHTSIISLSLNSKPHLIRFWCLFFSRRFIEVFRRVKFFGFHLEKQVLIPVAGVHVDEGVLDGTAADFEPNVRSSVRVLIQ